MCSPTHPPRFDVTVGGVNGRILVRSWACRHGLEGVALMQHLNQTRFPLEETHVGIHVYLGLVVAS